jgi:hypothetical protein
MSAAFDAASSASTPDDSGSALSWTHTPAGTPTAVVVGIVTTTPTVVALTYGGVAMTLIQSAAPGSAVRVEQWGLANPPAGPQTVAATISANGSISGMALTFTGSGTTFGTAFGQAANASQPSDPAPSVTVTGVSAGSITADCVSADGGAFLSAPNQTQQINSNHAFQGFKFGAQTATATGSVTLSWTSDQRSWASCGVEILAAAGAPEQVPYTPWPQLGPILAH